MRCASAPLAGKIILDRSGWATGPINALPILGPGNERIGLLTLYGNKVINPSHYLVVRYDLVGDNGYVVGTYAFTDQAPRSQAQMMKLVEQRDSMPEPL
jgi:hypothetical protein